MNLPKESRRLIYEAAPGSVTIPWPAGAEEPRKGHVYWMQPEPEERQGSKNPKPPQTHAEVMREMHISHYSPIEGKRKARQSAPELPSKRRRSSPRRPNRDTTPRFIVEAVTRLRFGGFEVDARLETDPKETLRLNGSRRAGKANPLATICAPREAGRGDPDYEPAEPEPEKVDEEYQLGLTMSARQRDIVLKGEARLRARYRRALLEIKKAKTKGEPTALAEGRRDRALAQLLGKPLSDAA